MGGVFLNMDSQCANYGVEIFIVSHNLQNVLLMADQENETHLRKMMVAIAI